ncbi:MAG: VCBS repeat-containing protein [Saprospiraceae bacterium]
MKNLAVFLFTLLLFTSCGNNGDHLFQQLDAGATGITFSNDLISSDTMNAFNFTNFYNGGGVGIADFNLDGFPDVCFSANQKDPELYLGYGQMQFEKIEDSGLHNPGWATGISIVDINQDGWPDIYLSVAKHNSLPHSANQLYINQQTERPTFKEEAERYGLAYGGFTMQTAFFDYDLDGDLDAYLLNTAPDGSNPNYMRQSINDGSHPSTDKLYENTGRQTDGTFLYKDISQQAGIIYEGLGLGIALADFNQDGWPDIYCSDDFQSDDALYLNQGDGTFRNVVKKSMRHTSLFGMGVDAADFNNDQHRDIFQLDMLPEDNERQKQMIARGDYEKKKLSTSEQYNYNLQYMRNVLQVNQGVGDSVPLFSEQGFMYDVAATDWSWSVLMADYDLDGWKDVFISNGYRKNVMDLDFISYNKNISMFGTIENQEAYRDKVLKELPEIRLRNYAFRNDPGARFENVSAKWGLDIPSYSNGAAYADLDLDGDLDLVVNNVDEPAFVFENRSVNKNYLKLSFQGSAENREGIGASVKVCAGDNCQLYDYFPVRGFESSMNVPLVIGLGKNARIDILEVTWPRGKKQILRDVAANQELILKEEDAIDATTESSPSATVFHPADFLHYQHEESDYVDFREFPTQQKMLTRNGPVIEKGNFNGDDQTDIIIGGAFRGSPTVVYFQEADGHFSPMDTLPTSQIEVGAIAVFDFNEDGLDDILVVPGTSERPMMAGASYQPLYFINTGEGFLQDRTLPEFSICSESAVVEDFNGDGTPDVLLAGGFMPAAYPETCQSVLLVSKDGSFSKVEVPWIPAGRAVKDMTTVDIDSDGDQDILLAGHWTGVGLLRNNDGEYAFEDLALPAGWWNCVQAADIDQDGDVDLLLGNEGLNGIFRASPEQPVSLIAKDFNGDGRIDPIYGLFLQDKEVPIHPLGTLTDQIVQFKKRYTRFRSYSEAGLNDLFTSGDLEGAQHFEVTELRTGIALNDGNGHFTYQPLPLAAQQAPVNDLLVQDFNGDDAPDLLLVGNFYPNEPVFGQSDASFGTLLTGDGTGHFKELPMHQSGLQLDGDARHVLYLPEQRVVVVTQNQGAVRVFVVQ